MRWRSEIDFAFVLLKRAEGLGRVMAKRESLWSLRGANCRVPAGFRFAIAIAPYWRIIKDDGSLNPKFPGGVEAQSDRLREEGHAIEPAKGKKPPTVRNFEKNLVKSLA